MSTSTALAYNPITSFNTGTGFELQSQSIVIDSNEKLITGGYFTTYSGVSRNRIIRLNSDGTVDSTFNIGTGFNNPVIKIALQSDGKILVGGTYTSYSGATINRIIRLNTDGTRDTTFTVGSGSNNTIYAITVQSDGKILIGGSITLYSGVTVGRVVRLNTNGSIDSTFNIGSGFNTTVYSIEVDTNGKIYVGGLFTSFTGSSQNYYIRLNSDGTKDSTFNIGSGFNLGVRGTAFDSNGKILVTGPFSTFTGSTQGRLIRLNSDGSKDTTLNIGVGFVGEPFSVLIDSDDKILVSGNNTLFTGTTINRLVRLNSNGTRDTTLNIGTGFSASINDLKFDSKKKIVIVGTFATYSGVTVNRIVKLNTDGTIATGTTATITGTQQIGDLAIVTGTTVNYTPSTNGGFTFWMGPDQDLGYVIGAKQASGNQPTPISGVTASLQFWRSTLLTEASFVQLTNFLFNQTFTTGTESKTYLNNNGYWTSYV
jgi:uncharacterized delta-60 repeat protein